MSHVGGFNVLSLVTARVLVFPASWWPYLPTTHQVSAQMRTTTYTWQILNPSAVITFTSATFYLDGKWKVMSNKACNGILNDHMLITNAFPGKSVTKRCACDAIMSSHASHSFSVTTTAWAALEYASLGIRTVLTWHFIINTFPFPGDPTIIFAITKIILASFLWFYS